MSTTLFQEKPKVIEGLLGLIKTFKCDQPIEWDRVIFLVKEKMAKISLANSIILSCQDLVRVSGRQVNLARSLSGICTESGELWQIYLSIVAGLGNRFFSSIFVFEDILTNSFCPIFRQSNKYTRIYHKHHAHG